MFGNGYGIGGTIVGIMITATSPTRRQLVLPLESIEFVAVEAGTTPRSYVASLNGLIEIPPNDIVALDFGFFELLQNKSEMVILPPLGLLF